MRATLRSYLGHVDHHIDQKNGGFLVKDLTRSDARDFIDDIQDSEVSHSMTKKVLCSLRLALDEAKSRSGRRTNPMAPSVLAALKVWKLKCPNRSLNLVFPNRKGNIENHSNIHNRVFMPLLIENGIVDADGKAKFSFHALRHVAASLLIEQGWPAKKIQTILGHASITMIMDVYGHLFENPEDDADLFEKMEADLMAV